MATTRESLDSLLATLKTELGKPGKSLLPLLGVMSRFPHYSLSNQLLILAQRPDASRVMGFRAWQKAGYSVRKGETGIAIYAPMRLKHRDTERDELASGDSDVSTHLAYRIVYVFDSRQVEPLSGTAVTTLAIPCEASMAPISHTPLSCLEQLKAHLLGHNVELVYETMPRGSYGYTDGRRITVNDALAPAVEFATLVHEAAHVRLHFPADRSTRPDLTTRETEAEAVAYVLCAQLGLPDTNLSVDYIRAYRGTAETLEASLERIRMIAAELADAITAVSFEPPDITA